MAPPSRGISTLSPATLNQATSRVPPAMVGVVPVPTRRSDIDRSISAPSPVTIFKTSVVLAFFLAWLLPAVASPVAELFEACFARFFFLSAIVRPGL